VAFAAPSLFYPMSWDTSVHYYVGREWALRGAVPYRDTFDHKLPGIHALHATLVASFGETMVAIRAFEIACVLALGAAAAFAVSRERRFRADVAGWTALLVSVFYFGSFDHWNTAQPELPSATMMALAAAVSLRARDPVRGGFVAGLMGGAALLFKPTSVLPFAVVFVDGVMAARKQGRAVSAAVTLMLGACVLPGLTLGYFASRGALTAMGDILVGANAVYANDEARARSASDAFRFLGDFARDCLPWSLSLGALLLALVGAAVARRRVPREHAVAVGLFASALLSVVVQLKFYVYHFAIVLSGASLLIALAFRRLARAPMPRGALVPAGAAAAAILAHHVFASFAPKYERNAALTARWLAGGVPRDAFVARFDDEPGRRPFSLMDRIGSYLRERSSADERILVRGESAEIYVVSGRRAPGRFFWSVFLSSTTRAYHRDAWLAEDRAAIERAHPRYVVCPAAIEGPNSVSFFETMGYAREAQFGPYAVLVWPR
jgi:hypothetical protein